MGEVSLCAPPPALVAFLCLPILYTEVLFLYDPRTYANLTKNPDITLDTKAYHNFLQELQYNNVLGCQSQHSISGWACPHATNRLILPKHRCCPLRVKTKFSKDVILTTTKGRSDVLHSHQLYTENQGQETSTVLFQQVVRWTSLSSTGSFGVAIQGCRKTVTSVWAIRTPWSALQTSVSANKAWWSMLSGTPIFSSGEYSPTSNPSK